MTRELLSLALGLALSTCAVDAASTASGVQPVARATSFVAGSVVGTPVAAVRRAWDLANWTGSHWLDEYFQTNNKYVAAPIKVASIVFVLPVSLLEAPFWSVHNAWVYSAGKPFSKDAFSLGDTVEGK